MSDKSRIVIIGGGSIGVSIAYYLTRHPRYALGRHVVTLIEATRVASGASGKAGGLIASWATPSCLAALSFELHAQLDKEWNGRDNWGYRRVRLLDCELTEVAERAAAAGSATGTAEKFPTVNSPDSSNGDMTSTSGPRVDWATEKHIKSKVQRNGGVEDSAQVHPYAYTTFLAKKAQEAGVNIIIGSVTAINYAEDRSRVDSVTITDRASPGQGDTKLPASVVVLAAGPWSAHILPKVPVTGVRNNSIVMNKGSEETSNDLLFFNNPSKEYNLPRVKIYPRPDDTVHVSAGTDYNVPLPPSSDLVESDPETCHMIHRVAGQASFKLVDAAVLEKRACYRPVLTIAERPRSKGPLVGNVEGVKGLIVATGHDEWGIQNAPATGKVVSELILDGRVMSADISSLAPGDLS